MNIKPKLRLFDLSMIVVSLVIGVGIFRVPVIVAQNSGTPLIFFLVWIFGGIVSICGALTFAEIGSRFPTAGGFYKIFSHCYHPSFAFMLNWSLVITNAASAAAISIIGAEYINAILLPSSLQNETSLKSTVVLSILILAGLNYAGIKIGARTQNLLSLLKIAMIIILCFTVFKNHQYSNIVNQPIIQPSFNLIKAFSVCLISVLFTYNGYQYAINFGADIQHPQKNIPKAIFIGMGIIIGFYLIINFAYYSVLGFEGIKHSKLLASELAQSLFGQRGYAITSIVIFISILGFINTTLMNNPRILYAMADDKILPQIFKQVNSKTMTQEFALVFYVALILLSLFFLGTFEKILNYVMFIVSISLVAAATTIFIFRKKDSLVDKAVQSSNNIYSIKLFPFIPLLFIITLLIVVFVIAFTDPPSAMYGVIVLFIGFLIYKVIKRQPMTSIVEINND